MKPELLGIIIPLVVVGSGLTLIILLEKTKWFKNREYRLNKEASMRIQRKKIMQHSADKQRFRPIIEELLIELNIDKD